MRINLKLLRVSNGFTQAEMAMRLGVSRTTYSKIESGKSKGAMTFWLAVKRAFPETEIEVLSELKERA